MDGFTGLSRNQRIQQYHRLVQSQGLKQRSPEKLNIINRLDEIYQQIKTYILHHQSPTTGLFPRYSTSKDEGYIRDSLYCCLASWALSCAYGRIDDDRGRRYELGQSAVKTMRGILYCWMKQHEILENFKKDSSADNALHSKFSLATGDPCATPAEYGHLQIDVVSLYLITLVQMIAGGLEIIFTQDEVKFIQNLVFYIERGYRTPDYGIWECGTRYNDGHRELHASSLGCVKAALEAINGFNLYGNRGTSGSVIYVDIDAHNRNRTTFETLLPRESNSKNTDAALISVLSYPVFATHAGKIYDRTIDKMVRRLSGKYGFKRFLRDGFACPIHDKSKRFYAPGETKLFDGIECQWPMFFVYMMIDSIFRGDAEGVRKYKDLLDPLLVASKDGPLLPQYYYVPEENLLHERVHDAFNQFMQPSTAVDGGEVVFLWGQSLYIIACMLDEKLVLVSEIDPIHRHLPASQRPTFNNRHSRFQIDGTGETSGSINDPIVQIALIAESTRLQALLATYAIQTQTPHQVEPVQIWSSNDLVKVFENLGKNERLKLSGRPPRPIGSLGTSKVYRVYGETVMCYPIWLETSDFYMAADPAVINDYIKKEINFVARRWKLAGRPIVCMLLREENIAGEFFGQMLELLVAFKNGYVEGTRVRIGRIQNLLSASCLEHLDFAEAAGNERIDITPFTGIESDGTLGVPVVDVEDGVPFIHSDTSFSIEPYKNNSSSELARMLQQVSASSSNTQLQILTLLKERHGLDHQLNDGSVRQNLEKLCHQACVSKNWIIVRHCAALLHKVVDSLAPSITTLLVRGKQLIVGVVGHEEVIDHPLTPSELAEILFRVCLPYDVPAAVLQQELILALAADMSSHPDLFTGTLKIRLGWLIRALDLVLNLEESGQQKEKISVYSLCPMDVKKLVHDLLSMKRWQNMSPLHQRQLNGALYRVPHDFYDRVWRCLEKTPGGFIIAGNHLPQQPTLSDMTEFELTFAVTVDDLLARIAHAEYRSLIVELFMVASTILQRNPELQFSGTMNMDSLVRETFEIFRKEKNLSNTDDITPFYELPNRAKTGSASYLARAVVNSLLKDDFSQQSGSNVQTCLTSDTGCATM